MATWKKVLRQDYAVGATDELLNLTASAVNQTATISLTDDRDGASEGAGKETINLAFSDAFTVGITGGNQIDIDLDADFTVTGDTGSITVDLNAASPTFAITANDNYLVTAASGSAVNITLDATQWDYTITGTGSPNPSSATHSIGDNITFGSTFGTVNAIIVAEATPGTITIDLDVAATTVQANGVGSSNFLLGETINFTSDSLTIGVSSAGTAPNRTLTVDLDLPNITVNGDNPSTNTWSLSTANALSITSVANSGLTVSAVANGFTIDQGDVTVTGTSGTATQTPVSGLTFSSTDGSVSATVGGGGAGAVTIDLEATPQVESTNANSNFYLLLQAATGDLAAKIDSTTGAGPTYNPATETLTVGNLTVDGTQTFLDTTHLAVTDKTITMAADSADAAAANGAALHVGVAHDGLSETGINLLPKLKWNNASELSGWTIADYNAGSAVVDKHVSTMQFAPTSSAPTAADRGDFHYDTTTDVLYVCIGN